MLVGAFRNRQIIGKVEALCGGTDVRQMQGKLPCLSGGYVGQYGTLDSDAAVSADLYVGILHLFRSVGENVLSRLVVLGLLFLLIGIVALSAEETEDITPSTWRLVDIDGEVGTPVAVVEDIVELSIVLRILVVVALSGGVSPTVLCVD